jgi:hypothetical protein
MGDAQDAGDVEGHAGIVEQAVRAAFRKGCVAAQASAPRTASARRRRGFRRQLDDDVGIEGTREREIEVVETPVADRRRDREAGDGFAQIAAVKIDQAIGVLRPFVEDRVGERLAERARRRAGKAEVDVLLIDRADMLRPEWQGGILRRKAAPPAACRRAASPRRCWKPRSHARPP